MARTPEAPDLTIKKSFPRYALEVFLRGLVIIWLQMQLVGFVFYMLWHNTSVGFREFMFRDFIDFWEEWDWYIKWQLTPEWLQWIWSIPTWQEPLPWIIIALLLMLYVWSNRGLPSLKFKVPRTYKTKADNPYNSSHSKAGGKASDDEFGFDPSAFGGSSSKESAEVKTLKNKLQKMAHEIQVAEQRAAQAEQRAKNSSPTMTLKSAQDLFEIEPPYTAAELKKRRMDLLKKVHPDTGGSNMMAKMVNEAYELLKKSL